MMTKFSSSRASKNHQTEGQINSFKTTILRQQWHKPALFQARLAKDVIRVVKLI